MKVYIASQFALIEEVEKLAEWLESHGHTITEKWWCRPYQIEGLGEIHTSDLKKIYDTLPWDDFFSQPETFSSFQKDVIGVWKSDVLIFRAHPTIPQKFNGATLESGIAIGQAKPVLLYGELETSVMFSGFKKVKNLQELKEKLEEIQAYIEQKEALNHHRKHGDMDGKICLLNECPIHYPKNQKKES